MKLTVEGMTCMHCAGTVKKAVESIEGASDANVDLEGKSVNFKLTDENRVEEIKEAIKEAGFAPS